MEETKSDFANHIGGMLTKKIDDNNYEFYAEVKDINLNTGKIAHGGFICSIADTGIEMQHIKELEIKDVLLYL